MKKYLRLLVATALVTFSIKSSAVMLLSAGSIVGLVFGVMMIQNSNGLSLLGLIILDGPTGTVFAEIEEGSAMYNKLVEENKITPDAISYVNEIGDELNLVVQDFAKDKEAPKTKEDVKKLLTGADDAIASNFGPAALEVVQAVRKIVKEEQTN